MNQLGVHKSSEVRDAIKVRGCELVFLPSYSPDLNPIEQAFSKLKTLVKRLVARTREAFDVAIAQALETVTL